MERTTPAAGGVGAWPLVGRERELARVIELTTTEHVRVVVLSGAAGVGKTRLAAEAADALVERGWATARVSASATLQAVPLAALVPLLGSTRPDATRLGGDPAVLHHLAASLAQHHSGGRRLALVVDDLPQLDPLSVAVIAQLALSGAVTVIATAREGDPLPDAVLALWTSDQAARLPVEPLAVEGVGALLALVLDGPVAHQCTVTLHRLSGGNALFLRELVADARSSGALAAHAGTWVLTSEPESPPALTELIATRLAHLSDAERDVMERLACCLTIPLEHLTAPEQRRALGSLETQGLIALREENRRHLVAIAHPQYIGATRRSLTTLRRLDLLSEQVAIAESLPARPGDAVRIASWRLEAGLHADPEVLETATRLAALTEDFELMAELGGEALAAGSRDTEIMLIRADALIKLGRIDEAVDVLERARERDAEAPVDDHRSARILTLLATAFSTHPETIPRALEVLEGAPERYPASARRLHLATARIHAALESPRCALDELALAGDDGSVHERGVIALNSVVPYVALTRTDEALAATERALAAARLDDAAVPLRVAYLMRSVSLAQSCRLDEARVFAADALAEAILRDDELRARQAEFTLAACYLAMGRLETSARWLGDVIAGSRSRGPAGYEALGRAVLVRVRVQQGQLDAARAVLADLAPGVIELDSLALLGWAWLEAATGSAATARQRIAERTRQRMHSGDLDFASVLAMDLARLGDPAAAAALLAEMVPESSSPLLHHRARTAAAMAEPRAAELVTIAVHWEAHGYLLHAAETFAIASEQAQREGSAREAAQLLTRSRALADRTEGGATPPLHVSDGLEPLTAREREIALLAARGSATNDIARQLFLSPRTVSNHLQSAYAKLGIRRRSELAAALGLVER